MLVVLDCVLYCVCAGLKTAMATAADGDRAVTEIGLNNSAIRWGAVSYGNDSRSSTHRHTQNGKRNWSNVGPLSLPNNIMDGMAAILGASYIEHNAEVAKLSRICRNI